MSELAKQIIVYSAAEQLAKDADFRGPGIDPYLDRALRYYGGDTSAFTQEERTTMRIQELHLLDHEPVVVEENPHLKSKYAASDSVQLKSASDYRNLSYYLDTGVEYELETGRLGQLKEALDMERPLSSQLMRERIVAIPGLDPVRLNVVYHDMMDHLWGISKFRDAGIDVRYADYVADVGYPFTGFLFSKQAELLSGIGYNARRYIADPERYGTLAIAGASLTEHLQPHAEKDERVATVIEKINASEDLAVAAGFVIKGAMGSLLLQRSRAGSVKRIATKDGELEITRDPVRLLDPRYLAIIIEGTETLIEGDRPYRQMQLDLNIVVESALRECIEDNLDFMQLGLGQKRDTTNVPKPVAKILTTDAGVSTSYYS